MPNRSLPETLRTGTWRRFLLNAAIVFVMLCMSGVFGGDFVLANDQADPVIGLVKTIRFDGVSGQGMSVSELESLEVELVARDECYGAASEGDKAERIRLGHIGGSEGRRLCGSAVNLILQTVSKAYSNEHVAAVKVQITRKAIEELSSNDGELVVQVIEGKVGKIRARLMKPDGTFKEDDPLCKRLIEQSIVQPGQLVRVDELDAFVARMNRQPGRRIDVALAPGEKANELLLDYIIVESRQPVAYARMSNTGTEATGKCRQQFGLVHYNLTRADDIFHVGYFTGDFDSVHAVTWSYDRPLEPQDRIRGRFYGSWRQYDATEFGVFDQEFSGTSQHYAGELSAMVFQRGELFVDAVGGIELSRVEVENRILNFNVPQTHGVSNFITPFFGLRSERQTERSRFSGSAMLEFSLPNLAGTDEEGSYGLDRLGRTNTDRGWTSFHYDLNHSFFLEPWLDRKWNESDHDSTLAHELAGSLHGQVVFGDDRVPANYMESIGGFYSVRGYPESFIAGDDVMVGSMEYRYHWPRSLKPSKEAWKVFGQPFRVRPGYRLGRCDWDLVFRGFFDWGRAVKHDHQASYEKNMTLMSTGLGAELDLRDNVKLRADWGWPLREADNGQDTVEPGGCRVHMSISVMY